MRPKKLPTIQEASESGSIHNSTNQSASNEVQREIDRLRDEKGLVDCDCRFVWCPCCNQALFSVESGTRLREDDKIRPGVDMLSRGRTQGKRRGSSHQSLGRNVSERAKALEKDERCEAGDVRGCGRGQLRGRRASDGRHVPHGEVLK